MSINCPHRKKSGVLNTKSLLRTRDVATENNFFVAFVALDVNFGGASVMASKLAVITGSFNLLVNPVNAF